MWENEDNPEPPAKFDGVDIAVMLVLVALLAVAGFSMWMLP
jgi:hypothetical protein